jgi:hypothetical protein
MSMGRGNSDKLSKNKRTDTQKQRRAQQPLRTETNRVNKWKKHIKLHPNYIQGIDKMRKALGI